jgi:peptide/nickel transport system permease protein
MSAAPKTIAAAPPAEPGALLRFVRGCRREWRLASGTVRASMVCLLLFYLMAAASPLMAPYNPAEQYRELPDCPPMGLHLSPPAQWSRGLFYFYPRVMVDPLARSFRADESRRVHLHLFYRWHLFSTAPGAPPYFALGSDGLGRDLLSRIIYGSRVSMMVGVIGVAISFTLGILVGAFSGYMGGLTDNLIMRWTEIEMSLPSFYLLLALAAVIPPGVGTVKTFFMIVIILSFIGWAGLARVIRGMAASVRGRPYVEAARALGGSRLRILTRHVVPSVLGYAVVAATLSIPGYIIFESALSFLGLGIQQPAASWGNLLTEAEDVHALAHYPWILIPGVFIIVAVMAFNFLGDHLRDRLDPSNVR